MEEKDIQIRVAGEEDAAGILQVYIPYVEKTAITFEYEVPSLEEFRERISSCLKRYPYLVALWQGRIIGYAYAGSFKERAAYDWACEMTIYLDGSAVGIGLGRRLYEALEGVLGRMNILNVNACIAVPQKEDGYLTNQSAEFHAHMGYRLVGRFLSCGYKFDRWYDMVWMEKMLGEHSVPAPRVKRFDEVRGRELDSLGIQDPFVKK